MTTDDELLRFAENIACEAGALLLRAFGTSLAVGNKGDHSNVVTSADLASEKLVVQAIRKHYPSHSVIAEEAGCDLRASDFTWVVDPLDGTSNFVAGIPWFGVLICVFKGVELIAAVLHLPVTSETYAATRGAGATKNGKRISVSAEPHLSNVLWAYGMDGGDADQMARANLDVLATLLQRVRNIRTTNSLLDAAFTADGRLGGMLNQSTRLWDIAAPMLIIQEAGGIYSDLQGKPLSLDLSSTAATREYAVLAGAPQLHQHVVMHISRS
jgi:myo-inositol-1(or 4)-monophosphatase